MVSKLNITYYTIYTMDDESEQCECICVTDKKRKKSIIKTSNGKSEVKIKFTVEFETYSCQAFTIPTYIYIILKRIIGTY